MITQRGIRVTVPTNWEYNVLSLLNPLSYVIEHAWTTNIWKNGQSSDLPSQTAAEDTQIELFDIGPTQQNQFL